MPRKTRPPTTACGNGAAPGLVLGHDVPAPAHVADRWFYLYLILDLYSRKIAGWEVRAEDDFGHAAYLVRRTAFTEGIATCDTKPFLHGDNGATLKAMTVLAMLHWLGVKPSYSRPRALPWAFFTSLSSAAGFASITNYPLETCEVFPQYI